MHPRQPHFAHYKQMNSNSDLLMHLCGWPRIFLVVMVVSLDASTEDFVVFILVQSDDTKTHIQPPLVPGTHFLPWHSAADDQYSGPFDMLPVVVEGFGAPTGRTLCSSSAFPS